MLPRKTDRKKPATTKDILVALKESTDTLGISEAEISDILFRETFDEEVDENETETEEEEEW